MYVTRARTYTVYFFFLLCFPPEMAAAMVLQKLQVQLRITPNVCLFVTLWSFICGFVDGVQNNQYAKQQQN